MSRKQKLSLQDVVSQLQDPNTSDIEFESDDSDDEEYELPKDGSDQEDSENDDDFSSDDDEPLANLVTAKTTATAATTTTATKQPVRGYRWHKAAFTPPDASFDPPDLQPPADDSMTPYNYFKLFVSDEMLDKMAYQTNLYSVSKDQRSVQTSKKEIEQVLGIYLRMGLVQMPNVRSYWEEDTRYPLVAEVMSRTRFEKLSTVFHFVDNDSMSEADRKADRVWKLRPWTDDLRKTFLQVTPEECNSVDEIMVAFKGRSLLRQYMPGKPHKWGFKLWGRCGITGFLYDFDIYQGKNPNGEKPSECGMGGDVVLKLVSSLPQNKNYKIFADNFFTGLPLIDRLRGMGFLYIGTIRANRLKDCPIMGEKELRKKDRGTFECWVERTRNIVAVRWLDNKVVNLVSSFVGSDPVDTARRYDRSKKTHVQVPRPHIIKMYNKFMGGVDLLDMLCSLYKPTIRCRRWYIYIWWHTITIAVVNAWLIYRRHQRELPNCKTMPLRRFQARVASALTDAGKRARGRPASGSPPVPKRRHSVQTQPVEDARRDGLDHLPEWNEKRQRCFQCPGNAAFTYLRCTKCKVWLCLNKDRNCFAAFHRH
ncbi:PREDICTED: piggyBac transposable element-derived protein 3-like [Priapulus caudatus]|uniref:PiggyBac transposable element-derived protein 3-like n=1 Tax=Priapulus caudatus TaxID=37621 RepID=A0ABM1EKG1_PRICU|nr:PREDICTED: piggyBac transposable element-derived protein 3-like [Priapulus caudatus]